MLSRRVRLAIYAVLGAWSIVCLFPVLWLAETSIRPVAAVERGLHYLPFIEFMPDTSAWTFILFDRYEALTLAFVNSLAVSVSAALLCTLTAALAVYALTRFPLSRARALLMPSLLATRILPPAVLVIPLYVTGQHLELLDSRLLLAAIYIAINLPIALWMMRSVLGAGPSEQEESALLDGASHGLIVFSVALPMALGGLAATTIVIFMLCWNEYLIAAYLATQHALTVPVWLAEQLSFKEAQVASEAEEVTRFAAAATLAMLPALGLSGVLHRWLTQALSWRD